MRRALRAMAIIGISAAAAACAQGPAARQGDLKVSTGGPHRMVLAGEWEYEDSGFVQTLRLNEDGNGFYQWKGGEFLTTDLAGQAWSGHWYQPGNDREGGFEILLTPDYREGEGRWWYTRIESNTTPTQPGGTFSVRRVSPQTSRR